MASAANPRVGIDLGGTKIEGVVLCGPRDNPAVLLRRRVPTESHRGYQHILDTVSGLIEGLTRECNLPRPCPVGIGMPGSITSQGAIKNSNTVCLNGTFFRDQLADRLGQPLAFANDANCFALAEATLGKGKGHALVFGVIMGTGTGGGLVVSGQPREGPQSICGEWGHMVVRPDSDRVCYCGQRGCVETYLAGPWIERHYQELSGQPLRLPEILARETQGEAAAQACVGVWLEHFGRALANLINIMDPDMVILGGGVSNSALLYTRGREQVARFVFTNEFRTPIERHSLGDSAGVFGAALLTGDPPALPPLLPEGTSPPP